MARFQQFSAVIIDLLLAYALSFILLSQELLVKNLIEYGVLTHTNTLLFNQVLTTILLFFILRFYFALIFAKTFGHFVCGVSFLGHSAVQKRMSVCLRVLLIALSVIFYPIDHILKKFDISPISDKVFGTKKLCSDNILSLVSSITFLVFLSFAAILAPFAYNSSYLINPKVNIFTETSEVVKKGKDYNLFQSYGTKSLQFSTFSDLDGGKYKINPSFEIRRSKGKLIYRPIVTIWNKPTNTKGTFKISQRFDFFKLISNMRDNYFLFQLTYPNLNLELRKYERNTSENEEMRLSETAQKELFELVTNSLLATPKNVTSLFKKLKFNIFPYLIFKNELFSFIGSELGQEIDFVDRGGELFLRTVFNDSLTNEYKERFFTYKELRPVIYEVNWSGDKFTKKIGDQFSENFFNQSKWGERVLEQAKGWEKDYVFNPLAIIDFIGFTTFSEYGLKSFEKYLVNYYMKEAKQAISESQTYRQQYHSSLQRIFVVWQLKMKNEKIPFSRVTVKTITDIMRAINLNDREFFGIK